MFKYSYACLFIFCFSFLCQAQESLDFSFDNNVKRFSIPDSLGDTSLKELKSRYYKYSKFPEKANFYLKCLYYKSLSTKDSIEIAKTYAFMSDATEKDSLKLAFIDKSIFYALNKEHSVYPAFSYFKKGYLYFSKANYKEALSNYFLALDIAQENNHKLANDVKFNIGLLKNHIGKYEEALKIFKECYKPYEKNQNKNIRPYLIALFAISDSYTKQGKSDSATTVNTYGIQKSVDYGLDDMKQYFIMNEGVNSYFKKQYEPSIDSIIKVIPFLLENEDYSNLIFSRFYLGKSYMGSKKIQKGINELKKVDSLLKIRPDFIPEIKETYILLIDYYKKENKTEELLYYHNRLAKYDSLMYVSYQDISDRIVTKFDTPLKFREKDEMILDLTRANSSKLTWGILSSILFLIICSLLVFRNIKIRRGYQEKFQVLLKENDKVIQVSKITKNQVSSVVLSKEIVQRIEDGLSLFIAEEKYLNNDVSVNSLAKKMGSNSKYLSQYLNHYKKTKFTDYINDLRITYIVNRLKDDEKIRKYTIKAISEIAGFSNPVSFSHAFLKKTGIKPSYFIKKLSAL
ncbi:AraC-type DNA-binding protein [Aquimarina amphilecti]|uniref:AraC-type DNA-binding protein n=1 Tax=Aquimarina amphilecti TaxID=1038014 RepID=A0A1H7FKP1_AQUAM|nr:helix-turn-helix domain-containing protein [Aquimarina amphilecti]SEK26673.1 AraC-type DNA-binding protein [Aquimarina amphilecti]